MKRLAAFLRRLHHDRSGQYTVIALFGAIPFVMLFVQIINIGSISMDRMKAQNAADAIAQSHAAWTARSLNAISANNTTIAQTIPVGVGSAALHGALRQGNIHSNLVIADIGVKYTSHCFKIMRKAASLPWPADIPIWLQYGYCTAEYAAAWAPAVTTKLRLSGIASEFDPEHGLDTSNKVIGSLSKSNSSTVDRAKVEIGKLLEAVARSNGATEFFVYKDCDKADVECSTAVGKQAIELPVMRSDWERPEVCFLANSELASEIGIDVNASFLRTLFGYTTLNYRDFTNTESPYTHGGSENYERIPDHIVKETNISAILYAFDNFYRKNKIMGTAQLGGFVYWPAFPWGDVYQYYQDLGASLPSSLGYEASNSPTENPDAGTVASGLEDELDRKKLDEDGNLVDYYTEEQKADIQQSIDDLQGGSFGSSKTLAVNQWIIHPTKQKEPSERSNNFFKRLTLEWAFLCLPDYKVIGFIEKIAEYASIGVVEKPVLYFLKDRQPLRDVVSQIFPQDDDEFSDDYKPLVFVYRAPTLRVGARRFFGMPERGSYAVAEAITYNTDGFDLYSQEWDARLKGISQFDDMGKITQSMDKLAPPHFNRLRQAYEAAVGASSTTDKAFGEIHAH